MPHNADYDVVSMYEFDFTNFNSAEIGKNDVVFFRDGFTRELAIGGTNKDDKIYSNLEVINSYGGNDFLVGSSWDQKIDAGVGHDIVYGDQGNDTIYGGSGNDELYGGEYNDQHYDPENDADALFGERGDDFLWGGVGDDTLNGGEDNDTLFAGAGDDELTGGSGADTFVINAGDHITDFNHGEGDVIQYEIDDPDSVELAYAYGGKVYVFTETNDVEIFTVNGLQDGNVTGLIDFIDFV